MSDYQKPEPSEDELRLGYFQRNSPWVKPGTHTYNTPLKGDDELAFRRWLDQGKVPFDPDAKVTDYDMRGFWKALQDKDPRAASAIDPNDSQMHYPDYWKTPYHQTFSAESQWANHRAPSWSKDDKLVTQDGKVIFDDRAQRPKPESRVIGQHGVEGSHAPIGPSPLEESYERVLGSRASDTDRFLELDIGNQYSDRGLYYPNPRFTGKDFRLVSDLDPDQRNRDLVAMYRGRWQALDQANR